VIILSLLNGSRLYHLNDDESDYDYLCVDLKPRRDYYLTNGFKKKQTKFFLDNNVVYDVTYVDFMEFVKSLIKCNPNYLIPMIEKKDMYSTREGQILMMSSRYFLDYKKIKMAFTGMAESAFNREKDGAMKSKYLAYYRDEMLLNYIPETMETNYHKIKNTVDSILWISDLGI